MYAALWKAMPQQPTTGEITHLLAEWAAGRPEAAPELWETVYRELRRVATACVRNQRPDATLQATALVNEAYIKVFQGTPSRWENRKHFFCAMARIMRQVMIDHARQYHAQKRGGEWQRVPLEKFIPTTNDRAEDLLLLHEALAELGELNPRQA